MKLAQKQWDSIAKPLHGMGHLEDILIRMAGIYQTANIPTFRKNVLVYCADNGVVAQGVTQSDSEVTAIVAHSIAQGTANVNLMSSVVQADVICVDIGMNAPVNHEAIRQYAISNGTKNIAYEAAMTREQALAAIEVGISLVCEMKEKGYNIVATGEMGIGNTTTSSAIASVLLDQSVASVTGRGAGLSNESLKKKFDTIEQAILQNKPNPSDALDVLCKLGGFDIAGMVGTFIGGAIYRIPIIIDGIISSVAALVASRIAPLCKDYMFASHISREPAMQYVLEELSLTPLITAGMALGEGTGAVALFPLLDMANVIYHSTHTFDNVSIQPYVTLGDNV